MTPREWVAWMEGFRLREEDAWRRTRILYSIIYNTNVEPRDRLEPEQLIPLPCDHETKKEDCGVNAAPRYLTDEERMEIKRKLAIKN